MLGWSQQLTSHQPGNNIEACHDTVAFNRNVLHVHLCMRLAVSAPRARTKVSDTSTLSSSTAMVDTASSCIPHKAPYMHGQHEAQLWPSALRTCSALADCCRLCADGAQQMPQRPPASLCRIAGMPTHATIVSVNSHSGLNEIT